MSRTATLSAESRFFRVPMRHVSEIPTECLYIVIRIKNNIVNLSSHTPNANRPRTRPTALISRASRPNVEPVLQNALISRASRPPHHGRGALGEVVVQLFESTNESVHFSVICFRAVIAAATGNAVSLKLVSHRRIFFDKLVGEQG